MSTSLKRQLAALAAPSSSLIIPERRRSSIIFSPQEAAKYNKDTFFQIGQDGLEELISVNPTLFLPFKKTLLFSEASKKFDRIVEDGEANEKLDKIISDFLLTLQPYLLMKASLKCLEWLVHRFHIERLNVDAILQCILPYYDTKVFVTVIQALEIEKFQQNQEWEWLTPCKHSGAPLRKTVLFDNTNSQFVIWMFTTFQDIIKTHKNHPENLRVYLGFLTSTTVGLLYKLKSELESKPKKVKNQSIIGLNILNQIFEILQSLRTDPSLSSSLLKNNEEIYSMSYIIMSMLAMLCREIPGMKDTLSKRLMKTFKLIIVDRGSTQRTETLLLINLVIDVLSAKWQLKKPRALVSLLEDVSKISDEWDVTNLATKLILFNLNRVSAVGVNRIRNWIRQLNIPIESKSDLLRHIYKNIRPITIPRPLWRNFIMKFERQHPQEFEIALGKDPTLGEDLAKARKRNKKGLVTLVDHSDASIRAKAVKQSIRNAVYNSQKQGKKKKPVPLIQDKNTFATALAPRYADESSDVLVTLWETKLTKLLKIFSPNSIVEGAIITLRKNVDLNSNYFAIQKLCDLAHRKKVGNELRKKIFVTILPYLFPRSKKQLKLTLFILKSEFGKRDHFLKQYQEVLKEEEELTHLDICKTSYALVSQLEDDFKDLFVLPNAKSTLTTGMTMTPSQITFACILFSKKNDVITTLLQHAETLQWGSCTTFPVTEDNFFKCVKAAEHKGKVSFELVLTALLKYEEGEDDLDIENVLKFVWRNCEQAELRHNGMLFLKQYLKMRFNSSQKMFKFWISMLKSLTSTNDEGNDNELFQIRALQFVSSFIEKLDEFESFESEAAHSSSPVRKLRNRKSVVKNEVKQSSSSCAAWPLVELILTTCLMHPSSDVRTAGIQCLKVIAGKLQAKDNFRKFLEDLVKYEREIIIDPEQIGNVMSHLLLKEDKKDVKGAVIQSLTRQDVGESTKLGLLKLCSSVQGDVFKAVFPQTKAKDAPTNSPKFFVKLLSCYDGSFDESLLNDVLQEKDTTRIVLKKIDKSVFHKYDGAQKKKILGVMIDQTLQCSCPETKLSILRCVRKWELDASLVATELNTCLELEKRQNQGQKGSKPSLRGKNSQQQKTLPNLDLSDWNTRAEVTLEFIQGKPKLKNKTKLINPLFKILKTCIALEEQRPVEYLKQLVLSSLTDCCQEGDKLSADDVKDFDSFDVQTVIDCLRCSRNPQTHQHALLLLNYAASRYQEQVLHGIMSLFTFMGNSILRMDDSYSTQLIQQTVINIIPTLAKTKGNSPVHKLSVSAGIFKVFSSAVQDIPAHRRLPVFVSLVETLNPAATMWQLCIILVDNALQRDRKRSNLNADLDLAVELVWKFDPLVVAQTVKAIYAFLVTLPVYLKNPSQEQFSQAKLRQTAGEKAVLDFSRKENFRDVLITVNYVIELMTQICSRFADLDKKEEEVEYDAILEKCLQFSKKISSLSSPEEKLFRLISHKNLEVIDKINSALDPLRFIEAITLILVRDDVTVKRKILEIFNQRILQKVEWFGNLEDLLELVPLLVEVSSSNADSKSDELTTLVQTSFFSLKLLSKHLALQHPDTFIPVFELSLTIASTTHNNKLLRASALLCLSELFGLKSLILPRLNDVSATILKALKAPGKCASKIKDEEDGENSSMTAHLLCISAITCLNKMVEQLGPFVGMKFLRKSLISILSINTNSTFGSGEKAGNRSKVFEQKVQALLKVMSSKIAVRNLILPLREAFAELGEAPKARVTLMKLLKGCLVQTSKADFTLCVDILTEAFLGDFLPVRETGREEGEMEELEDSVIDCLISGMVLKMTESHFRPLYHRIFDWAKDGGDERLVTFYRFSASACERLKSLFVTFAGYVTSEAVRVLHNSESMTKAVIKFFLNIFSNDKEGFVTSERFNAMVQPLVDLIESDTVIESKSISISEVNACLVQLAVATNDLNRWQHLVDLIGMKSSHPDRRVRLNILSTVEAVANELGKDFLPLLPPAVPFLAEMMNDDDQDVEAGTQKLLLKLEDIVGEPLQPYFTT